MIEPGIGKHKSYLTDIWRQNDDYLTKNRRQLTINFTFVVIFGEFMYNFQPPLSKLGAPELFNN